MEKICIIFTKFDPQTCYVDLVRPWNSRCSDHQHSMTVEWTKKFSDQVPKEKGQPLQKCWNMVQIIGPPSGVSLDTPLLESLLAYLVDDPSVHLKGFIMENILINTTEQAEWLEKIVLKHHITLHVFGIARNCAFAPGVFCDELFCALQRIHNPMIIYVFVIANFHGVDVKCKYFLRDPHAAQRLLRWMKAIAHLPSIIHVSLRDTKNSVYMRSYPERYISLRNSVFPAMRRDFLHFATVFAQTEVSCLAIIRIFAHVFFETVRDVYRQRNRVPDDARLLEIVYDWDFSWKSKTVAALRNRPFSTEYFCRNCAVPLCRVEQPLRCSCDRATFCCVPCQKQYKKDRTAIADDAKWQAKCCLNEQNQAFVYCKQCIPTNYYYCSIDNTLVCKECYFGSCPRLCGQTFSKEQWATQGKEHSVKLLCFNSECKTYSYRTCTLKDTVQSGRKNMVLCNHCIHADKFRNKEN